MVSEQLAAISTVLHEARPRRGARAHGLPRLLRAAVRSGDLGLARIPRERLAAPSDAGWQASLIWSHPAHGPRPVSIGPALRCGLAGALTDRALHAACLATAAPVALPIYDLAEDLPRRVAAALGRSGLAPAFLELQIAERLLRRADVDIVLRLCELRDLGVGVALHRFGAGGTSLDLLRRLPLSGITLDPALIRNVPGDASSAAILRAVIAAAQAFDLPVTADGIETPAQLDFLRAAGCSFGQGALIGQNRGMTKP